MSTSNTAIKAVNVAQRELAAFLRVVAEVFGASKTQHATDLWLNALEKTDQIGTNSEKFFRLITIQATHQLAKEAKVIPAYASLALYTK
jgi:hypothetical protein